MDIRGWETTAERALLTKYAQRVPVNGTIVEIGAEFGLSAALLASASHPTVRVHSVDLFPPDTLNQYRMNLTAAKLIHRVVAIQADSRLYWRVFEKRPPIDLLFVDGDHSYEGALSDLVHWSPLVKPGGFMLVHDCACQTNALPHKLHHEVSRAIATWQETCPFEFLESADSTMVFQCPP